MDSLAASAGSTRVMLIGAESGAVAPFSALETSIFDCVI